MKETKDPTQILEHTYRQATEEIAKDDGKFFPECTQQGTKRMADYNSRQMRIA